MITRLLIALSFLSMALPASSASAGMAGCAVPQDCPDGDRTASPMLLACATCAVVLPAEPAMRARAVAAALPRFAPPPPRQAAQRAEPPDVPPPRARALST